MSCRGNDPYCPCQDGDACHYVDLPGSPAMKAPRPRDKWLPLPIEMHDAMRKAAMPNNPKYAELTRQARKLGRL